MSQLFGPASANMVDTMNEDDCVPRCRQKVAAMIGEEKAKVFDSIS